MAAPQIRDRVVMECLEGVWETLEGNQRCRFRGTVHLTVMSLEHLELLTRVLEELMEWIQPTPTPYVLAEPIQIVEVTSSEEDPEEDLEKELEVQQPEPNAYMLPVPEVEAEPVIELNPVEKAAPEPAAESIEESGPGWLVKSDESQSQDYRLEWLAPTPSS